MSWHVISIFTISENITLRSKEKTLRSGPIPWRQFSDMPFPVQLAYYQKKIDCPYLISCYNNSRSFHIPKLHIKSFSFQQSSWDLVKKVESYGSSPEGTPGAEIVISDSGEYA